MKKLNFFKYSGNGNDFIILEECSLSKETIVRLCDRHFGIGADGILMDAPSSKADAKMRIFNADGSEAEMCGNGVRCFATYLDSKLNHAKDVYQIETMNAVYPVTKRGESFAIEMTETKDKNAVDLSLFNKYEKSFYINTGVPHLVFLVGDAKAIDIKKEAPFYRYHPLFSNGTNVNFVQVIDPKLQKAYVRTYERGVEDETYSCGTGLTANAIALSDWFGWRGDIHLVNKGGHQLVSIDHKIFYSGEVTYCFKGEVEV